MKYNIHRENMHILNVHANTLTEGEYFPIIKTQIMKKNCIIYVFRCTVIDISGSCCVGLFWLVLLCAFLNMSCSNPKVPHFCSVHTYNWNCWTFMCLLPKKWPNSCPNGWINLQYYSENAGCFTFLPKLSIIFFSF